MTYTTPLRSAVCVAALFIGGTAHADVTAEQVWDNWQEQMSLYGENGISVGGETVDGDTLTVSDIVIAMDDGLTAVEMNMGDLVFTEQGDGTVAVTMAESYPMVITGEDGVVVTINVMTEGQEMIVSGEADALNYDVTADSYTISLQDIVDGDLTYTGDAQLTMNDMAGTYTSKDTGDDLMDLVYDISVGSVDILVDFEIPGGAGEYVTASGKIENIAMDADFTVPTDLDFAELDSPDAEFPTGLALSGSYTVESAAYVFDINADGDQAAGSASSGDTALEFVFNNKEVGYSVGSNDLSINITAAAMPFPVEIGLEEYGVGFQAPLGTTDDFTDFGMNVDLVGLSINDTIWDLVDGGQVLPRTPATVQLAIAGKAKALVDFLDPSQADALAGMDMPYELESMTLETLNVDAVGTTITGAGDFTFDNSDLETFDGLPRPEGEASIQVNGLNQLLDNLVAMGLVPEDQIMGGRMMMGMFARSTGDDQLETTLEVNDEGHVLVNGQRMR